MVEEIYTRTSVRDFLEKDVSNELILTIIKAGMQSPSAKNQQPWEFYIVKNKELIEKLSSTTPYSAFSKNASVIIVPCYKKDCIEPDYSVIDLSICMENMWLETEALGLGGCMIGIAPIEKQMNSVKELIKIEENLEPYCLFPIAYPSKRHNQQNRYKEEKIHFID